MTDDDLAPFPADEFEYRVVADRLEARIHRGEFGETGKLPSARDLMAHYGVGAAVVSHARRELKERGLVYSDGWRGTFTA
jgi:DNA-binding GntR family transcriptional regulator